MFGGEEVIINVRKGALNVMRGRRIASNIYILLGNIDVCDIASVEYDNDATKL